MRRRLAVFWITLAVIGARRVRGPSGGRSGPTPEPVPLGGDVDPDPRVRPDHDAADAGGVQTTTRRPAASPAPRAWVRTSSTPPRSDGIDVFDPQTGQYLFGFSANPTGYAQLAGLPDGSKLYALRTDRSAVDVFADNTQLARLHPAAGARRPTCRTPRAAERRPHSPRQRPRPDRRRATSAPRSTPRTTASLPSTPARPTWPTARSGRTTGAPPTSPRRPRALTPARSADSCLRTSWRTPRRPASPPGRS